MKMNPLPLRIGFSCLLFFTSVSAWAVPEEVAVRWHPLSFGSALGATLVFGLVGIGMAILGFKIFDALIRFNLEKEICENKNIAAAILSGSIVLGICLIIAAAVMG